MPPLNAAVELTLRSLDGLDDFDERKIILNPNTRVSVGRSSKSAHKNLQSGPDNAYIDSPVISRDHAVFWNSASCGIPQVYIKDNGSMHGTTVNSMKIQKHRDHPLKTGDTLQFGVDVVRDHDTFIAKKFRFESKPAPLKDEESLPRAFSVPEAETSEEEESDEEFEQPELPPRPHKYGTQSNPVNVDDFADDDLLEFDEDDNVVEAAVPKKEGTTQETRTENVKDELNSSPLEFRDYLEDNGGESPAYESDSASSQASKEAKLHSYVEDADEDSEDELQEYVPPGISPMESKPAENVSTAPKPPVIPFATEKASSSNNIAGVDIFSDTGSDEDSDDLSVSESEDSLDDETARNDHIRRFKLLEMLKQEHQKQSPEGQATFSKLPGPSNFNTIAPPMAPTVKASPLQPTTPSRSTAGSMSLQNIMVNDKDLTPMSRGTGIALERPTEFFDRPPPSQSRFDQRPANVPTSKENELKDFDMGQSTAFSVFEHSTAWAIPPRPTAPKPVPWGSIVPDTSAAFTMRGDNEPWFEETSLHDMYPLQSADFEYRPSPSEMYSLRRSTGEGASLSSPAKPYGPSLSSFSTVTASDDPFSMPEQNLAKVESSSSNLAFGLATGVPTPPAGPSSDWSAHNSPQTNKETSRPRTRVSITEIVENTPQQPPTPTSVSSLKRKADVLEAEEVADGSNTSTKTPEVEHSASSQAASVGRPAKKVKLGFKAGITMGAALGTVVGALGVVGALINLPESFFQ